MAYKTKVACIYHIRRLTTGDGYVGSTSSYAERRAAHTRQLAKGVHHSPHLQNAWTKHGAAAFDFIVLEVCVSDKRILKEREDFWMRTVSSKYNVLPAAYSSLGFKQPREGVERRAAAQRGVPRPADVVARMAAGHRGMKMPRGAVERTAAANRGRVRTPAEIEKLRASLTGKKKSPAHVAAMRQARVGFKHTDAAKEKNRIGSTGRVASPETLAKMRASSKLAWRRKWAGASLSPEVYADGV